MSEWQDLCARLIAKYNDGYVTDEDGEHQAVGYPEDWLRTVVESRPGHFELEEQDADAPGADADE
jgi:hypothetical protein